MANKYLSFIDDNDFLVCIEFLCTKYKESIAGVDSKKFFKNRVDPIKFLFDKNLSRLSDDVSLANEIKRQSDKTFNNSIGTFHEMLLGYVDGYTHLPVGNVFDLKKDDNTLFAEIKNKHNTTNSSMLDTISLNLSDQANLYPNATCYYVRIIDKQSQNKLWIRKDKEGNTTFSHSRVRIISGDQFYKIVTGVDTAFKELCDALPIALNDYITANNISLLSGSNMGVFTDLTIASQHSGRDLITEMFYQNLPNYLGY